MPDGKSEEVLVGRFAAQAPSEAGSRSAQLCCARGEDERPKRISSDGPARRTRT